MMTIIITKLLLLFCANVLCKNIRERASDEPLNLTPLLERGEAAKARKLSSVDPTLFAGVSSHAAFFNVNKTQDWNTFFWFFPAEGLPLENTPWVIWLQGGPGCSSLYGLFTEIGPIEIVDGKSQKMPVTWGSNYSLLFIDNPVGAGFSYTSSVYTTNEDEVGASLLSFIQQFLQVFPELRKAPLFITGESYAGKYIPAFGHYIHHNKNDSMPINLKGLAIGDGWTDPPTLQHYSEFALQIGVIDEEQYKKIKQSEDEAIKCWEEGDMDCFSRAADDAISDMLDDAGVNPYNYLTDDYDYEYPTFLNRSDVRAALHVGNIPFDDLNDKVYSALSGDMYQTVKPWLEELLESYGVMCYSGQLDVIVAYALSVHTYRSLKWSGADDYLTTDREIIWNSEKKHIGFVKEAGNFMEVMVRGAGHMVPHDQPAAAKYVLDMFINKFKQ